ncbi:MAG: phosphoenolpyruvate--protein phosphotransferase [Spirochaetes bacterium]|nr:phosphoenolpyruvate--protein phosphotransferase [Spirochaetota bacterium]
METDHIQMLLDIGELNNLFTGSISIEAFLQKIVELVASHMKAQACSIYLYDESTDELVLKSAVGLDPGAIDSIKIKLGEGLMGHALQEMRAVCENTGEGNSISKFYPEAGEELYNCYLAIPIARGSTKIGVMAVQRGGDNYFGERDVMALRATTSQLAPMIENVKLLMLRQEGEDKKSRQISFEDLRFVKGKPASSGYAYEPSVVLQRDPMHIYLASKNPEQIFTIDDFQLSLQKTESDLERLQAQVELALSDAASLIFASHLLILKDRGFTGKIRLLISEGMNPPQAVMEVYRGYREIFQGSENPLIREKVQDIEDLCRRIIDNMYREPDDESVYQGKIVIARELYPSDLLMLSVQGISGVVLTSGGVTSHVGILARSLHIPAVIVDKAELLEIPEGTKVLIDADLGNVYINPSPEITGKFHERERAKDDLLEMTDLLRRPTVTKDGVTIRLKLNVNLLSDVSDEVIPAITEVGLYRTEFPFLIRNGFPSEEEQYIVYRKLVDMMQGKAVTFRTLDIGGDKILSYYQFDREDNPFLGMRSIRFSLFHEDIFAQQVRAILRAGAGAPMKIMFPMISSIDEFLKSRDMVYRCIKELAGQNIPFNDSPEIGLMIEIPSMVNLIDDIAAEADFFSIGTNDLIQYTLAVDRTNERVAHLFLPHHPAVLRSLKMIADAANSAGIHATICGDMANSERYVPFLLGCGFRDLSVDAIYLSRIKRVITETSIAQAEEIAANMLATKTVEEITAIIGNRI